MPSLTDDALQAREQQVFAVLGARTQPLAFSTSPSTPLLGRDHELGQLLPLVGIAAGPSAAGSR